MVAAPALVLADEPTGSLDADRRDEILEVMFATLPRSAFLIVTHDPAVAARADRIVRMDALRGRCLPSSPTAA